MGINLWQIRQKMNAGKGQSVWVTVICSSTHSPHNRIHGRGDRHLCAPILWNQDNSESWAVPNHFHPPEGADVWPDQPRPLGVRLSSLGWRPLISMRKPKPAERKWNKKSGGEQSRGYYGYYNHLNPATDHKIHRFKKLKPESLLLSFSSLRCWNFSRPAALIILNWIIPLSVNADRNTHCEWKWHSCRSSLPSKHPPGQFSTGWTGIRDSNVWKDSGVKRAFSVWGTTCKRTLDTWKQHRVPVCFIDAI